MKSKKTVHVALVLFILLLIAGGTLAYSAISRIAGEEIKIQPGPVTRFYVTNDSEIRVGTPALYNVTIENQEGVAMEYGLKVQLAGREIYNQEIMLENNANSNQIVSFIPRLTGDYQKIEFLLYKGNEPYKIRVFQILPAIDNGDIPPILPPQLQNGNMEQNIAWNFSGKGIFGTYSTSGRSNGMRSYQMKAAKGVKKGAFGSIVQGFSSDNAGLASLSFDVRNDNASYSLQAVINDNKVWESRERMNWTRIRVPVFLKESNSLELKVLAENDTESGITAWWDNVSLENYSPDNYSSIIESPAQKASSYTMTKKGDTVIYGFNSGEKLELEISNNTVNSGKAVYNAAAKGDFIIFLGEKYEKVLPPNSDILIQVIAEMKDKRINTQETLDLKNGYSISLNQIDNGSLNINVSKDNRIIKDFISWDGSPIEYWKEIDDYKKQKVLQITPKEINQSEAVIDIMQYGSLQDVFVGDYYEDFKVTKVTKDSITMKNNESFIIEAGKELSLIKGKIKIDV